MACARVVLFAVLATGAGVARSDELVHSLRRALRDKDATLRAARRTAVANHRTDSQPHRRLSVAYQVDSPMFCAPGDCSVDITTGVAGWTGAHVIRNHPHWAQVLHGSWIGATQSNLVARVQFHVTEPSCASFELAIAADGTLSSALLNGRSLPLPPHGYQSTTALPNPQGLVAARGQSLFAHGTNHLVLAVTNDAGATGLYVNGAVHLLCPLDEATISMHPALGPAAGGTLVELRSNIHLYVKRWVRCNFGQISTVGTVVDASAILCRAPLLPGATSRGWVNVELATSHQGRATVGINYKGPLIHLVERHYYMRMHMHMWTIVKLNLIRRVRVRVRVRDRRSARLCKLLLSRRAEHIALTSVDGADHRWHGCLLIWAI